MSVIPKQNRFEESLIENKIHNFKLMNYQGIILKCPNETWVLLRGLNYVLGSNFLNDLKGSNNQRK
jgi:hypothetical protein